MSFNILKQSLILIFLCYFLPNLIEATPPLQAVKKRDGALSQYAKDLAYIPKAKLPDTLYPTHYQLTLIPVIDELLIPPTIKRFDADGIIRITVSCLDNTRNITLHSSHFIVIKPGVEVTLKGTTPLIPIDRIVGPQDDILSILLTQDLEARKEYEILIRFVSPVATDRIDGLYLSKYTPPGTTEESLVAVTQFAAIAARQAFPCFDEPRFKSAFDITIGRIDKYSVLSNSPLVDTTDIPGIPGWKYDTFNTTVKMPVYLVAILVSEYGFEQADLKLPGGQPVRVYAPKDLIGRNGGVFASNTSAQVMTFFHNYFDMEYKMDKMDSAVVPDFYFGAMENWGLITYRELYLMHYVGITTEVERARISNIIAHESSHQWFGNLITCKRWNHVWLNEGFATYLSYIGANYTHPEFEPIEGMLNDAFQYSMTFDQNPAYSHPIRNEDSINAPLYDRINYDKAASLIRMMESFLTPNTLKRALQILLKQFEFMSVEQDDLFLILTKEGINDQIPLPADGSVKDIMDTWTRQSGYPLVRVMKGFVSNTVQITQERFRDDLPAGDLDRNVLWYVPITIATQDNPNFSDHFPKFWIDKDKGLVTHNHNLSTWIIVNPDATGYYRVHYDPPLLALIKQQLDTTPSVISPASRSQLLDDYFTMAFHGFVRIETALEMTSFLHTENDIIVWETFFTNLRHTLRMLSGTDAFDSFGAYILPKISAAIQRIGYEQPEFEIGVPILLRVQLLDWACSLGLISCLEFSSGLFMDWEKNPTVNPIPIDLQPVVYCAGIAHNGSLALDFALNQYEAIGQSAKQKQLLLNSFACIKNQTRLETLLNLTLDSGVGTPKFPTADKAKLINQVFLNSEGRNLTLNFIHEHFRNILTENNAKADVFSELFISFGQYCNTRKEFEQIQNFITEYKDLFDENVAKVLNTALTSTESNIVWISSYYQPMNDWFKSQITSADTQM